jgi:transposase
MNTVSVNTEQNATRKHLKVHRPQRVIVRKVISFQELRNLERHKKSEREAAKLLEVPNSTMQDWIRQESTRKTPVELTEFFATAAGADFLQRNIMAVMKLMKCGPGGIRGMQEYLHNSGLDAFVASSEGALQNFWVRCENYILEFNKREETRLSAGMRHRKITAGLDEMFRGKRPCLVAIEVVSNYILLEKFTEDRTAATWKKELEPRLNSLNIEVGQVVSDLCGAIRSVTKGLGAEHISELFHAQYEISKATAAPLASQERYSEQALNEMEEKFKKANERPRRLDREERQKQLLEVEKTRCARDKLKVEFEEKAKRREEVKASVREMSKIHHPINLKTGALQTAEDVEDRFGEQFKIIYNRAEEANLSEPSIDRIEKAQRAFAEIVCYMKYFFTVYAAFVECLCLGIEQEKFFNEVIFPLSYLRMIWGRLPKKAKEENKQLLQSLEAKIRDAPWPEQLKLEWMKMGREIAEVFQRSSSCVEGRNGVLSLNYHRFHRLNERSLKVLTIVHNFDVRRPDGTTAAERFFEAKHDNLFECLVANVRIPGRPQKQHHDIEKRLQGREKRLAA